MSNINKEIALRTGLDESIVRRVLKEARKSTISSLIEHGKANILGMVTIKVKGRPIIFNKDDIKQECKLKAKVSLALESDVEEEIKKRAEDENISEQDMLLKIIELSEEEDKV